MQVSSEIKDIDIDPSTLWIAKKLELQSNSPTKFLKHSISRMS